MSSLITVTNRNPDGGKTVALTVQAVKDGGRERHYNGVHFLAPGKSKDVLLDEDTCVRLEDVPPETPAEVLVDEAPTATDSTAQGDAA